MINDIEIIVKFKDSKLNTYIPYNRGSYDFNMINILVKDMIEKISDENYTPIQPDIADLSKIVEDVYKQLKSVDITP